MRRESGTALGTRGVLVFSVGGIQFGAQVEEVAGLIEADHIAPLPRQSGAVAGVLAFRGAMIPALDFCAYLDVPGPAPEEADEPVADGELSSVIGAVYMAASDRVHCLRYWAIFDSVVPPAAPRGEPAALAHGSAR